MALRGNCTEEKIWNYLLDNGINPFGAAGLMGNWQSESSLCSYRLQGDFEPGYEKSIEYTKKVDNGEISEEDFVHKGPGGGGYGLAQWTWWSRKKNLYSIAKSIGKSIGDLEVQLDFAFEELSKGYKSVLDSLKSATSVRSASDVVLLQFERPADQSEAVKEKRAEYGQVFYDKYVLKNNQQKGSAIMSNSSLVTCTVKSPNHSGTRTHAIDRITPHCVVGQLSASSIGGCFTSSNRPASCNYGIGTEGGVCLIVDEENHSWCSSSNANDQRAVTIECASDKSEPYAFNNTVYNKLVELCVDICKRNGKKKLIWISDKNKALAYSPKIDEMQLTVHRWFANKSCPGDWLFNKMGELASTVTSKLGGSTQEPQKPAGNTLYRVQTGAFSVMTNADNLQKKLKEKGYDTIIVQNGGMYKVQVGAYSVKGNAENMMARLKADGFDAFITTASGTQVTSSSSVPAKKTNAEIAKEIYRGTCSDSRWGTWGNEPVRSQRLTAAGYDPVAVQREVDKLF